MANDMTPDTGAFNFDPVAYFAGSFRGYGLFEDRKGRVRRRMALELSGARQGDTLTLDERFFYDDGTTETRTWQLTRSGRTSFTGLAVDCVGQAVGTTAPAMARTAYNFRLKLPKSGRTLVVTMDDRLHQVSDRLVLNRATVSKWGVKLGELFLVLERVD